MSSNPNAPNPNSLNDEEKRTIIRQFKRRMFWKLLAVGIVVVAYLCLRGLDTATQSYEAERGKPIVLVGEEVARENATEAADAKAVSLKCPALYNSSSTVPKKRYDTTLVRMCAAQHLIPDGPEENEAVRKKLGGLKNQYFPDEQALISRLDQEIRAEADLDKKALISIENAESRNRASKLPNISKDEYLVHEALKKNGFGSKLLQNMPPEEIEDRLDDLIKEEWEKNLPPNERYANDQQIQDWQKRLALTASDENQAILENKELIVLHEKIVAQADYGVRFRRLKKEAAQIEDKAQKQINLVYEKLKPALSDLIKVSPGAPNLPAENEVRAWFNPRSLLDTRSSAHVIYETVQLTLSMVLVLGVIFLLVLVLRILPFFADSTDRLKEIAEGFLQRTGGTVPSVAKSLVVTASALAIGTAVVVASNKAINPPVYDDPSYVGEYNEGDGKNGTPGKRSGPRKPPRKPPGECQDCGEFTSDPSGDRVDFHVVKLEEPIAYPSPITVTGTNSLTLTSESIKEIKSAIELLVKSTPGPTIRDVELERQIRTITDKVVTEKLTTISSACCKAGGDKIFDKDSFLTLLQPTFTTIESIRKDLDATKKTLEELRLEELQNDKYQPQTDSGGRGLFTRTKQFFKGDKYLVTQQTVADLRKLMFKLPVDCKRGTDTGKQKCCDGEPVQSAYCTDAKVEAMLGRLREMVGNPPASESDFMNQLRTSKPNGDVVDKTIINKWKSVILRYARVPY